RERGLAERVGHRVGGVQVDLRVRLHPPAVRVGDGAPVRSRRDAVARAAESGGRVEGIRALVHRLYIPAEDAEERPAARPVEAEVALELRHRTDGSVEGASGVVYRSREARDVELLVHVGEVVAFEPDGEAADLGRQRVADGEVDA